MSSVQKFFCLPRLPVHSHKLPTPTCAIQLLKSVILSLRLHAQDYGINDIATGLVADSVLLFSGSLFGELICWHPAAFESTMTYQVMPVQNVV